MVRVQCFLSKNRKEKQKPYYIETVKPIKSMKRRRGKKIIVPNYNIVHIAFGLKNISPMSTEYNPTTATHVRQYSFNIQFLSCIPSQSFLFECSNCIYVSSFYFCLWLFCVYSRFLQTETLLPENPNIHSGGVCKILITARDK